MFVHFFERTEESGEGIPQTKRHNAARVKIPRPELIGDGDGGRAHWTVFMRAARPRQTLLTVDPQTKSHVLFSRGQQGQEIVVRDFLRGLRLQSVQQQVIAL